MQGTNRSIAVAVRGAAHLVVAALLIVGTLAAGPAAAQGFPNRAIKLVYPFPAGSATDLVYRPVADFMTRMLGQSVIMDAKPGGGSMVASLYVKTQPADGYTIYAVSNSVTEKSVIPNAQIDIRKDFTPIAPSNLAPLVVLVNPDQVKATTMAELVAEAKAKPGQINYASYGVGSGSHMFMEILLNSTGAKMVHVPYQGTAQAVSETAAGRVQVTATIVATARSFVSEFGGSGKLRMIGESLGERTPLLPNTPGMKEAGYPGIDYPLWGGYVGPVGTPKEAVDVLNRAINASLKDPTIMDIYKRFGLEGKGGSPEDLTRLINTEFDAYVRLIRDTGLKLD